MNKRYFIGALTITGIIGLTAYSIYLWKKQQKEDEEAISYEEAMVISRESKEVSRIIKNNEDFHKTNLDKVILEGNSEIEEVTDEAREQFENTHRKDLESYEGMNPTSDLDSKVALTVDEIDRLIKEDSDISEDSEIEEDSDSHMHDDEGVGKLRHDPNSEGALIQFHNMELAEWSPSDITFQTMIDLLNIPFNPSNQGDNDLFDRLVDYRVEFFGNDSKWNERVSFGDVLLYFARRADYNIDEGGYKSWVESFVFRNNLDSMDHEDLLKVVQEMVDHSYYNDILDAYGLFNLKEHQMVEAEEIASRNIDPHVTFDIEFNVFLKHWPNV